MKLTFLSSVLLFSCTTALGQKPLVTLDTYKTWTGAYRGDLSIDGRYAMYTVVNDPVGSGTLVITETGGKELSRYVGVQEAQFTSNSGYLVGRAIGDSLLVYDLKARKAYFIADIRSFKVGTLRGDERLFLVDGKENLLVTDFKGQQLFKGEQISQYVVAPNGSGLVMVSKEVVNGRSAVQWIDAYTGTTREIYTATSASGFIFDAAVNRLAFMDYDNSPAIVYCDLKSGKPASIVYSNDTLDVSPGSYWCFSRDAERLFFSVTSRTSAKKKSGVEGVEIWSYQDDYLKSFYNGKSIFGDNISQRPHIAVLDINSKRMKPLTSGNEKVVELTLKPETENYCIIEATGKIRSERWPDGMSRSYFLCNTFTGERSPLELNQQYPVNFWNISPGQKFVAYYKIADTSYYTVETASLKRHNITSGIGKDLIRFDKRHYPHWNYYAAGMLGWLPGDRVLLINGSNNVWSVDPLGIRAPKNITAMPGKDDRFAFSIAGKHTMGRFADPERIILTAFNLKTKDYGFFSIDANGAKKPEELSMRKWYLADVYTPLTEAVCKSTAGGYLLRAENSDQSGNYYFSKDFKTFSQISHVNPESNYNYITSELLTYKDSLGRDLEGVLYKPVNFDPSKKYPIIFTVYELQGNKLNMFIRPELRGAVFTLPWMISNGYLVFAPDIKCLPRNGGPAIIECIDAAVNKLAAYSWADTSRLGISGHSVGGFVTNYTASHSNHFKAAIAGAGISDMMRAATELWDDGAVKQEFLKDAAYMMETDLLNDQEAYLRNSAVLAAEQVNTPLLLLHNDSDESVRYEQSRSFFILLRKLQKPCWWLNYLGQGHQVMGSKFQIDYNIRVKAFYDHYLKAEPMPDWMKDHL